MIILMQLTGNSTDIIVIKMKYPETSKLTDVYVQFFERIER